MLRIFLQIHINSFPASENSDIPISYLLNGSWQQCQEWLKKFALLCSTLLISQSRSNSVFERVYTGFPEQFPLSSSKPLSGDGRM